MDYIRRKRPPGIIPVPPQAYFKYITDQGKVCVGFTSSVYEIPDIRLINNATISLNDLKIMETNNRLL